MIISNEIFKKALLKRGLDLDREYTYLANANPNVLLLLDLMEERMAAKSFPLMQEEAVMYKDACSIARNGLLSLMYIIDMQEVANAKEGNNPAGPG